ncbi:ribbon-helix-helix domain-containing protein [Lonsdalea quercina]|uniref:ribbon-helix-helix domain-containing protein n=1 Tax=Lonsdalea quercina TaxID=71657 RepID=UPI0039771057
MSEPHLKNRHRFTSSIDKNLVSMLDDLAIQTRIPKSRLLDEAISDLLLKHGMLLKQKDSQP